MRVFISYSRIDEQFVRQLTDRLETAGIDVWLDVDDIHASEVWSDAIQRGLDESDVMVLVITRDSMQSPNVAQEWHYFDDQKKPIVPVWLKPAKLPFQLARRQYVNFEKKDFETAFEHLCKDIKRAFEQRQSTQQEPNAPFPSMPQGGRTVTTGLIAAGVIFVLVVIAILVQTQSEAQRSIGSTKTAVALLPTLTSTPTITKTPPPTFTPSMTYTPSKTPPPTSTDTLTPTSTPNITATAQQNIRSTQKAVQTQTAGPTQTALAGLMTTSALEAELLNTVRLMSGPGNEYSFVTNVAGHSHVKITGMLRDDSWYRVSLENGTEGWVSRPSIKLADRSEQVFGPAKGSLAASNTGNFTWASANVSLADFVAEAIFTVPYDQADGRWSVGFEFRKSEGSSLRVGIQTGISDYKQSFRFWGLYFNTPDVNWKEIATGGGFDMPINLAVGATNRLTLIAVEDKGWLYVNDSLLGLLDLSALTTAGDISVLSTMFKGDGINGKSQTYQDFIISRFNGCLISTDSETSMDADPLEPNGPNGHYLPKGSYPVLNQLTDKVGHTWWFTRSIYGGGWVRSDRIQSRGNCVISKPLSMAVNKLIAYGTVETGYYPSGDKAASYRFLGAAGDLVQIELSASDSTTVSVSMEGSDERIFFDSAGKDSPLVETLKLPANGFYSLVFFSYRIEVTYTLKLSKVK